MKNEINKIAILGSGVMGSRIACHFANIGVQVLLLDIVPREVSKAEKAKGLTLESPAVRNRIVNDSLQAAIRSKPSPLYRKEFANAIATGNFDDHMKDIEGCDWILEAVIENPDIKRKIFDQVEKHRRPGTIVTSNTSGIPIQMMAEGRSDDFQAHFCGTHFFNPPRYLRLLELIPAEKTSEELLGFLTHYGDLMLGKTVVRCKDTPAFIANRVGIYGIMDLFHSMEKLGLGVEDVDKLAGTVMGRPKSAVFRTCDVVGLDTIVHVSRFLYDKCPDDSERNTFQIPPFIEKMVENNWLGDKTGQGFYKKIKGSDGKSEILALDLKSFEYKPRGKTRFKALEAAKQEDDLRKRLRILASADDEAGAFYRQSFYNLFHYVSHRLPEISDQLFPVDLALRAGFGWELGPFELWDALGVSETADKMEKAGKKPAPWVLNMISAGKDTFWKHKDGARAYFDTSAGDHKAVPGQGDLIFLDTRRESTVWKNSGADLVDLGDGILNVEFHTKMNTIGGEVVEALNKAMDIAEKDFRGLVVANEGQNFSAGANLAMIFMFAVEQEFDEIDLAVRTFQQLNMRIRCCGVPVIVAPHGMSLGGGCEMSLHADQVQAAAETYTGLVEFGVGLIPGGGGTKEFVVRFSDELQPGDIELNTLRNRFLTIGQAQVSTSAKEAFDLGVFRKGIDEVTVNRDRLILDAKRAAINMAEEGYVSPKPRKDIRVLGKSGLGMIHAGANAMLAGHYISPHDKLISEKLGFVMCGGDLSAPTEVSEQYLLDLEREAFLSLCGEKKTLERIQAILTTGKPLRN